MNKSKIFGVLALVAGLLCAGAFELAAQTVYSRSYTQPEKPLVRLYRDGTDFYLTDSRQALNDIELEYILGQDVYRATVEPAMKHYKAGKRLLISGGVFTGAGITLLLLSDTMDTSYGYIDEQGNVSTYSRDSEAVVCETFGAIFLVGGFIMLTVGTPLYCSAKGRLNWAVDDYNMWSYRQQMDYSVNFGAQKHGIGLGITF